MIAARLTADMAAGYQSPSTDERATTAAAGASRGGLSRRSEPRRLRPFAHAARQATVRVPRGEAPRGPDRLRAELGVGPDARDREPDPAHALRLVHDAD